MKNFCRNDVHSFLFVHNHHIIAVIHCLILRLYCKNKYNYTNDDIHYFKYSKFVEELKKYYLYFDIKNSVFLISLSDTKANDNIIGLGCLKKDYEGELNSRDKELFLLFKYTKV